MTNITRRTFVKRSGAATLGSALGLGILPSLTRRLHAEDTSTSSDAGVSAQYTSIYDLAPFEVNGGTLTVEQKLKVSAPAYACVSSLQVVRAYTFNYIKTVSGVVYRASAFGEMKRYYKCINGIPTITYAYGDSLGPVPITSVKSDGSAAIGLMEPAIRESDGGTNGQGEARFVFSDGKWGDWNTGANLPYQVFCCVL